MALQTQTISRRQFFGITTLPFAAFLIPHTPLNAAGEASFIDRLQPDAAESGFAMDGYFVWGGSVIRGEDGKYHMFTARWPAELSFEPHWLTNSEVVRAVADQPAGPFEFAEIVLPVRGGAFWDGRMTHDPAIQKSGETYLLYYTGTTYGGETPQPGKHASESVAGEAFANQRIGLATASSLSGPWTRRDAPVVMPRPSRWDTLITASPGPCVLPDGSVLLIYESTRRRGMPIELGVAKADRFDSSYRRLLGDPIFRVDDQMKHVEEPYVWQSGNGFELLMTDPTGRISGERGAGVHASSEDGVEWNISPQPKAYSRTMAFADGKRVTYARAGRPQLLIEDGKPTHLFLSVAGVRSQRASRTIAIPLAG